MPISRYVSVAACLVVLTTLAGCSCFDGLGLGDSTCEVPAVQQPCPQPCPQPCDVPSTQPATAQTPPEANPGEVWCYVRVPAVTRSIPEQVCVREASCRQEWVPPETQQVDERVCVTPGETRRIPIPARFETVSEQVQTCAGRTEWQRVECEPEHLAQGEQLGECWTLKEIPPVFECRSRQVCVQEASCREEVIPPVYEMRTKTVTVREGYNKPIEIPPVYETRYREEDVCPPRWEWRRTTECEVPGMLPQGPGTPAPVYEPAPAPAPDNLLPPAGGGGLGAGDPFAPQR